MSRSNPKKVVESLSGSEEIMDDDLAYDDKDREWLESLSDIQREEILYERMEQKKDLEERKRIQKESKQHNKGIAVPKEIVNTKKRGRTDDFLPREGTIRSRQSSAIEDIKAKRQGRKMGLIDSDDDSVDNVNEPIQTNYSSDEQEQEMKSEKDAVPEINIKDIKRCIVSRSKLEKWYGEPFFNEKVPGLFIRIAAGGQSATYRLVEINSIIEGKKTYKLGKKDCKHVAAVKVGNLTKHFELQYVSNSAINESEFQQWLDLAAQANEVPNKAQIDSLVSQIAEADNYVYTDNELKEAIKKNREKNPGLINQSIEILRLNILIKNEEENGNDNVGSKVAEYRRQLDEIQSRSELKSKALTQGKVGGALENINKRNSNMNFILTRTFVEDDDVDETEVSAFKQAPTKSKNAWLLARLNRQKKDTPSEPEAPTKAVEEPKKIKIFESPQKDKFEHVELKLQIDQSTLNTSTKPLYSIQPTGQSTLKSQSVSNKSESQDMGKQRMSLDDYKKRREETTRVSAFEKTLQRNF